MPVARLPDPSEAGNEGPVAIVIGHPAPRIARDPHVASARIKGPTTILEGAPVSADEVRLPDVAVAGQRHKAAVVIQVTHAVAVGRVNAGAAGGRVAVVIISLLAIPRVGGFGFVVLGDFESVFLGRIAVGSGLRKIDG